MTTPSSPRIAGAPISWGVSEVPGWGFQFSPEHVLDDMRTVGLTATEFGPVGFLPDDGAERRACLARYGLSAVGGFLPVLLHDAGSDPLPEADAYLDGALAAGGRVLVLAASTGVDGYNARPVLDDAQWATLLGNLDRLAARAAERGALAVLHPHMGTMVENADDVSRVLDGSVVQLCIDTGHLVAAGADPVAITAGAPGRVGHVHLKDVDAGLAARVRSGELAFSAAVAAGLFRVLGTGSVDVGAMIATLEGAGYRGWYVLEQDLKLEHGAPDAPGPLTDVQAAYEFVRKALG
ncbi:TIM barrel protein [Cryptosporangium phraense]|uniref:TIM barrel protein n=1 Tax=Cryptosporangium phraense TaxID=2593070 RepID=A0A545ATZ9_9ACTN|nr:TIM barrel protein [Cryptosporangium phraense]TQS44773.1 TIM barrel protein [Cryptosporangium phraense]